MKFRQEYWDLFKTGTKILSTRDHSIVPGLHLAVSTEEVCTEKGVHNKYLGVIKTGEPIQKTLAQLTERDAKADGFKSLTEYVVALCKCYQQITLDTPLFLVPCEVMTIITVQ